MDCPGVNTNPPAPPPPTPPPEPPPATTKISAEVNDGLVIVKVPELVKV
jgi:hypothetical protein